MTLAEHAVKIITYLNTRPGSTATLQEITTAMAKQGMGQGILNYALNYLLHDNQISHSTTNPLPYTIVHHYSIV